MGAGAAAAVAAVVAAALVERKDNDEETVMRKQRKYLDRGRKIELEGRPFEVDWMTLLGAGRSAVQRGRADEAAFLSEVMWEDVDPAVVTHRPAALDYPLMRRWLDVHEDEAIDYLMDEWGLAFDEPAPENAGQANELLELEDCITAGRGAHMLSAYQRSVPEGTGTWFVGYCSDCLRAILMWIDDADLSSRWWPFYDQESA
ncbi:hypothetical protein FM103_19375 [Corynebacterium xerosis]|nr:hypothetical protein FM103_19375 [Corynebacterium xerosis]